MRIVSLVPENTVPSIYRSLVPMQALAHRGHTVHVHEREDISERALLDFDVVHIMRISHPLMVQLARRLRQRGIGVVWDNDDERVAIVQEATRARGQEGMAAQRYFASMRAMTRLADAVTTPSDALARFHAADSGREVRILDNRLPPTFARPTRVMPHQGVRIGWHAMPVHAASFEALGIRAALERLLARHAHLAIVALGVDVGLRSNRYVHGQGLPYNELPGALVQLDVALAPLADTPVNRARSDVKLKEYAAAGVPWLASPVGPYAGLGEQQGGRLVADGDWPAAIDELAHDADARRVLAQRGLRWAESERIEAHVDAWEETFEQAIAHARTPVG